MKRRRDRRNSSWFENKVWLSKLLFSIIFVLISLIYMRVSDTNKSFYKDKLLQDSINFQSFGKVYDKYFGNKFKKEVNEKDEMVVFSDNLVFSSKEKVGNSYKLNVGMEYGVPALKPGIIVFIGEKDDLGKTIIVQGNDGVDVWYSNLINSEYGMYDYVSKGDILGTTDDEYLFLSFNKNGTFLTYEEYIK